MPDLVPDWYCDKRNMMKDAYDLCVDLRDDLILESDCGVYSICSIPFDFSSNTWYYNKCVISSKNTDRTVEIIRNYGNFPYCWVKKHKKRRKYLVCAEDTHGITVVDLSSGKVHTWIDEDDDFWPREFHVSPDGSTLAVWGSVMGELDKIRFYDFTEPIRFPYTLKGEFDGCFHADDDVYRYPDHIVGWDIKGTNLRVCSRYECDNEIYDSVIEDYLVYMDGQYIFDCSEIIDETT